MIKNLKHVNAGDLSISYYEVGPTNGIPIILLHGFPYDIHAYKDVSTKLTSSDRRILIPYLRGYGKTRFLKKETLRSGQQAALASTWSPSWNYDDATYNLSSASFENNDFTEVVIHSYRHRFGLVNGDPKYDPIEQQLTKQPPIKVPSITIDGASDGVTGLSNPKKLEERAEKL